MADLSIVMQSSQPCQAQFPGVLKKQEFPKFVFFFGMYAWILEVLLFKLKSSMFYRDEELISPHTSAWSE
jgi:hypothetical protein